MERNQRDSFLGPESPPSGAGAPVIPVLVAALLWTAAGCTPAVPRAEATDSAATTATEAAADSAVATDSAAAAESATATESATAAAAEVAAATAAATEAATATESATAAAAESATAGTAEAGLSELLAGMGVRWRPGEESLEIDGWVNMPKGLVEVAACTPDGKTHESVVVLDCVPSALHAGLLALGLEPGRPVEGSTEADYRPPTGPEVTVEVKWKAADGTPNQTRIEDWVWNRQEGKPMRHVGWLFTGSFLQSLPDRPDESTYAANYIKSLVTTYHDASTVLENPLREGGDDTIWYANEKAVPPARTPVTCVFRPAR